MNSADDPNTQLPGALQGRVQLIVQTHQAQRLLRGRPRRADQAAIVGLMSFASRLRPIWQAALCDDPYADWALIRIESALAHAHDVLSEIDASILEAESTTMLTVMTAQSTAPLTMQLRFATPYGYQAAALLAELDGLVRRTLTARYVGTLNVSIAHTLIERGARGVRGAFASAQGYRNFHIDRASVTARSTHALEAESTMGKLPDDIVRGNRVPALRPQRKISAETANGSDTLAVDCVRCPVEPDVEP